MKKIPIYRLSVTLAIFSASFLTDESLVYGQSSFRTSPKIERLDLNKANQENEKEKPGNFKLPDELSKKVAEFEKRYGVTLVLQDCKLPVSLAGQAIFGKDASDKEVSRYLPILLDEFSVYPQDFISNIKLEKIVICKELGWGKQKRAAVPDFRRKTLYYDCKAGKHNPFYQRIVIHHEFFHTVDFSDDRLVYRDKDWVKLNSDDFRYGRGGASVQGDGSQFRYRNPTDGFITKYSTSGVEEDKAETFAHLIVNPSKVKQTIEKDERLASKVAQMKRLLRDISEKMDDTFWKQIAERQKKKK